MAENEDKGRVLEWVMTQITAFMGRITALETKVENVLAQLADFALENKKITKAEGMATVAKWITMALQGFVFAGLIAVASLLVDLRDAKRDTAGDIAQIKQIIALRTFVPAEFTAAQLSLQQSVDNLTEGMHELSGRVDDMQDAVMHQKQPRITIHTPPAVVYRADQSRNISAPKMPGLPLVPNAPGSISRVPRP